MSSSRTVPPDGICLISPRGLSAGTGLPTGAGAGWLDGAGAGLLSCGAGVGFGAGLDEPLPPPSTAGIMPRPGMSSSHHSFFLSKSDELPSSPGAVDGAGVEEAGVVSSDGATGEVVVGAVVAGVVSSAGGVPPSLELTVW